MAATVLPSFLPYVCPWWLHPEYTSFCPATWKLFNSTWRVPLFASALRCTLDVLSCGLLGTSSPLTPAVPGTRTLLVSPVSSVGCLA